MQTIYLHLPRRQGPRVIDITPMPWWSRTARALLALLIFLVAVPLLWFVGAIFAIVFLVGAAAMLANAALRSGDRPRAGKSPPR